MIQEKTAIAVTMALLLKERAILGSSRNQKLAEALEAGNKIPANRDLTDVFAMVCQSYRLKGWEWKDQFFLE